MSKDKNIVEDKAYDFALAVVKWYRAHIKVHKEFVLGKQLLRSATSVGANVSESKGGISDSDFSHKLSIAYKEVQESKYWIKLLYDSEYIPEEDFEILYPVSDELGKILFSILRTMGRTK